MIEAVLEDTGYLAELEADGSIEAEGRLENLQELVGVCREFDEALESGGVTGLAGIASGSADDDATPVPEGLARVQTFLEAVSLVTDLDDVEGETSAVTLMTLHSAKGLEFPASSSPGSRTGSSRTCAASAIPMSSRRSGGSATSGSRVRGSASISVTRGAARCSARPTTTRRAASSPRSRRSSSRSSAPTDRPVAARAVHRELIVAAAAERRGAVGARGAESLGLRIGDDVGHETFGEGVIIDVIGDGDRAEALIRFRDVGEKRLLLAWAPLQKLGR